MILVRRSPSQLQIVRRFGKVALHPDLLYCQPASRRQPGHLPVDLVEVHIFTLPRHGEKEAPERTKPVESQENPWSFQQFLLKRKPFTHLMKGIAEIFPCDIHDEGLTEIDLLIEFN